MFESLSERLQVTFKKLRGQGKLSEKNMKEGLREVRMSLLEADVNFKVVKDFIQKVEQSATGGDVLHTVSPTQQLIKIIHDELVDLMGGKTAGLNMAPSPPTIHMLTGLQGSGKTTTAGKLAHHLSRKGHRPMLVAADVYRPAAIAQLQIIADGLKIPFFTLGLNRDPVDIALSALGECKEQNCDVILLDTAGRLHIDKQMMQELVRIKEMITPHEILLIADSMTGQDAVNAAKEFNDRLGLTGAILTKLDGDARGGAALSIRAVAGCPIKFVGIGEKSEDLDVFHPDRMASRILGMGDVVSLVEKAQKTFDEGTAAKLEEKIRKQRLDFEDMLDQFRQVRKLGSLDQLLGMIPGMGKMKKMANLPEEDLARAEAIICSMTSDERQHPKLLNGSRRRRIARGSGATVQDVNKLVKQLAEVNKMMKKLKRMKSPPGMAFG